MSPLAQRTRAGGRPPLCSSTSPTGWPSVSLTVLKWSRSTQSTATPAAVAAHAREHLLHAQAQQHAVGQRGQRVVVRHVGDARLGALALGDVDRGDQHGRHAVVASAGANKIATSIGVPSALRCCQVLPASSLGASRDQRDFGLVGLGHGCRRRFMRQQLPRGRSRSARPRRRWPRGCRLVERADEHRHRIAVEQQAEGLLALLHLGDVDAQADDAAVAGAALLDQDTAAVGQPLLVAAAGISSSASRSASHSSSRPIGFRIVAALDADAQRVREPRAGLEQVGAALVDFGVLLVPQDVAALRVEEDDALRQDVDRFAQPRMRLAGSRRSQRRPRLFAYRCRA